MLEIKTIVNEVLKKKTGFFYNDIKIVFISLNKIENFFFENNKKVIFIICSEDKLIITPILSEKINLRWFLNTVKIIESKEYSLFRVSRINEKFNEWVEYAICEIIRESNKTIVSYFEIYTDMFQRKRLVKNLGDKICVRDKITKEYELYKDFQINTKDMRIDYKSVKELLQAKNFIYSKSTRIIGNNYIVEVSFLTLSNEVVFGTGISEDYYKALNVAIYEIIERFCGIVNYGDEWTSSTTDLNYESIPFLNPNHYFIKRKNQTRIKSEENINWVSSYNITKNKTMLIPKDFVFYKNSASFIKSSSNGHAIGNSILEAIIHSIYELVERDLFLNYWHNKSSPVCINISSIDDKDIKKLINSITFLGYKVYIYEMIDNEFLSAYWIYVEGEKENKFSTYSTAGAHKHNITAIKDALKECYFALYAYNNDIIKYKEKAKKMKEKDVRTVNDHPLYYSIEERKSKFDFLKKVSQKNLKPDKEEKIQLVDYFENLIKYVRQNYGNIYIVKTTNNIASYFNLECVKVFLEEGNEMYFGYENQNLNFKNFNSKTLDIHPFP